jgi:hypothetical protein
MVSMHYDGHLRTLVPAAGLFLEGLKWTEDR